MVRQHVGHRGLKNKGDRVHAGKWGGLIVCVL
jgi:hypothetical protein